jgi:hypothetical protein
VNIIILRKSYNKKTKKRILILMNNFEKMLESVIIPKNKKEHLNLNENKQHKINRKPNLILNPNTQSHITKPHKLNKKQYKIKHGLLF